MTLPRLLPAIGIASAIMLSGCSSLWVGDQDETITLTSNPSGASVTVSDITRMPGTINMAQRGEMMFSGKTPATIKLPVTTKDGEAHREYVVAYEKVGYAPYETRLEAKYLGWSVKDPATGKAVLIPDHHVDAELQNLND